MTVDVSENEVLQAKRDVNVHGVGLVFLVNGLILGLFWAFCYRSLGGVLSAHQDVLPGLAVNGYTVLGFGSLGYILVMDMDTAFRDGRAAARRITMDWMWLGLLPVAAYIAVSAFALSLPEPEPRHAALGQGLLSAALILYGFLLTRMHFPQHAPPG